MRVIDWLYRMRPLPSVRQVEVIKIGRVDELPSKARRIEISSLYQVFDSAFAPDDVAREIIRAWRFLPPGEQARCHTPPFALRFYTDTGILLTASLCWHCNNIHMDENGVFNCYEFHASAPVSQHLFALCEQVLSASQREQERLMDDSHAT